MITTRHQTTCRLLAVVAILAFVGSVASLAQTAPKPNIIIILADDLGWGDVGFNGCREIPTPHLDALARSGVVFTSGYASHPYCSPSRAGLLTGRYAQRFGHECNPGAMGEEHTDGLPLDEVLLPNVLKDHGYRTACIGKWHLGDDPKFWPTRRGFDEWFGFSGGGVSYWGDIGKRDRSRGVLRNGQPVPKTELSHLTDDFSREAAAFIERHRARPFFLYLAYNAPHAPDQAMTALDIFPTEVVEGTFAEKKRKDFTSQDVRFTQSKDGKTICAILLGWPGDRATATIRSLAEGQSPQEIISVSLLGHSSSLPWSRDGVGLKVTLPAQAPSERACVIRISTQGEFSTAR